MNLTNMLSRLEAPASVARLFRRAEDRIAALVSDGAPGTVGEVSLTQAAAANDRLAPANDGGRPHIVARRAERRLRREVRSA